MDWQVQKLLDETAPRAGPLIISVFGDSIAPRSADIWLGSLIEFMKPLGLSERLVRTGVYRLSRDGWLKASQKGRRSFYHITPAGMGSFADADERIYAAAPKPWNGNWTMVQLNAAAPAQAKSRIRKMLKWLGFGKLSPTLLLKPGDAIAQTGSQIANAGFGEYCAIFSSTLAENQNPAKLIEQGWDVTSFATAYDQFLKQFKTLADRQNTLSNEDAFIVRTLLVHQYRRILLKDPQLPDQLLPSSWKGEEVRQLAGSLYRAVSPGVDRYIKQHMECAKQNCPDPAPSYYRRFVA